VAFGKLFIAQIKKALWAAALRRRMHLESSLARPLSTANGPKATSNRTSAGKKVRSQRYVSRSLNKVNEPKFRGEK